jgi:hypothetical protein
VDTARALLPSEVKARSRNGFSEAFYAKYEDGDEKVAKRND